MKAQKLRRLVDNAVSKHWADSNIYKEEESMLIKIADHFKKCSECKKRFNTEHFEASNLEEFSKKYLENTKISDWICNK